MSDVPQGTDWWQASDGKWYPPQPPAAAPPPPTPTAGIAQPPGVAYAAPPPEPSKKKRTGLIVGLCVCGALFALVIIGGLIAGSGSDDDTTTAAKPAASGENKASSSDSGSKGAAVACKDAAPNADLDTQSTALYAGRPDAQDEDHEASVGDCVRFQGYTAYVQSATTEAELGELGGDPITVVNVKVENRDDQAKPYNLFDWSLQTPSGQVIDPTIYLGDGGLQSGDLVPGGSATGKIAFDAPAGQYYVIYKPDAFDSARGIWQIRS